MRGPAAPPEATRLGRRRKAKKLARQIASSTPEKRKTFVDFTFESFRVWVARLRKKRGDSWIFTIIFGVPGGLHGGAALVELFHVFMEHQRGLERIRFHVEAVRQHGGVG